MTSTSFLRHLRFANKILYRLTQSQVLRETPQVLRETSQVLRKTSSLAWHMYSMVRYKYFPLNTAAVDKVIEMKIMSEQ